MAMMPTTVPPRVQRNHTGQGADPVADPAASVDCDPGYYEAGEAISLTADPAPDWSIGGWAGIGLAAGLTEDTAGLGAVIYLGIVPSAIAYAAWATALSRLPALQQHLATIESPLLAELADQVGEHRQQHRLLNKAIIDSPPMLIRDGGVIAPGYDEELDRLRALSENAGEFLLNYEQEQKEETGISSLKVGYNRVHGYYIEISRGQSDKAPDDYVRRQTLKGAERFVIPELKKFEDQVLSARERALAREKLLYEGLLETLGKGLKPLQRCAEALAELDVFCNLAERAQQLNLTRPQLREEADLEIRDGRHPVVEQLLVERALKAYDSYEFHVIYHRLYNYCTVDLSSFYLDILKDRLYTTGRDSLPRRSAQTAMFPPAPASM